MARIDAALWGSAAPWEPSSLPSFLSSTHLEPDTPRQLSYMSSNAIQEKADAYELEEANLVDADLPARHKALVRKLDWRLSPLFWLVYLITFIDRASVGNARVAGLEADLGKSGSASVKHLS